MYRKKGYRYNVGRYNYQPNRLLIILVFIPTYVRCNKSALSTHFVFIHTHFTTIFIWQSIPARLPFFSPSPTSKKNKLSPFHLKTNVYHNTKLYLIQLTTSYGNRVSTDCFEISTRHIIDVVYEKACTLFIQIGLVLAYFAIDIMITFRKIPKSFGSMIIGLLAFDVHKHDTFP